MECFNSPLVDFPEWPPVNDEEIIILIDQLKIGKAPGPDLIIPEVLKADPEWWAPLLATLFTMVNKTGQIPVAWRNATIVPIYKKGCHLNPANYRPINLLSIIGKLYAKHLQIKLNDWMLSCKILGPEQIGFSQGKSAIDHCLVLSHLIGKFSRRKRSKLYTAFLDLKGAFDSVSRGLLWEKLESTSLDKRLLFLIKRLYTYTSCQVRCSTSGRLSSKIITNKGVKQGCILAPFLFNLFLNDLVPFLSSVDGHSPRLGSIHVPLLSYADDVVLLSVSRVGLKSLLNRFCEYCVINHLDLNYEKSKVMVFSNSRKLYDWNIKGNNLEQVKHFKYLGVYFQFNASWTCHWKMAINTAKISASAIARFYFSERGNQYVPAALKAFNAKNRSSVIIWCAPLDRSNEYLR